MALVTTKWKTVEDPKFKISLSKAIKDSAESSPDLVKEVNKIFKQANTRINRLKDSGLYKTSPAYQALGSLTTGAHETYAGRTYFTQKIYFDDGSTAVRSWEDIKEDYKRAIGFLNQTSSTVAGAREVEKVLRENAESYLGRKLPEDVWEKVKDSFVNDLGYIDERLMRSGYAHYIERFADYIERTQDQMERDGVEAVKAVEQAIQDASNDLAGIVIDEILGSFLD